MAEGRMKMTEDEPVERLNLPALIGEGDDFTYVITNAPELGRTSIKGNMLRYQTGQDFQFLKEGQNRVVEIEVRATDGDGVRSRHDIKVLVRGSNDAPEITNTRVVAFEDGPWARVKLSTITEDPEGQALTYDIIEEPGKGMASIRNGFLRFNPGDDFDHLARGEYEDVRVRIQATDPEGAWDRGYVWFRVRGENDAPEMTRGRMTAVEDGPVERLNLKSLSSDPDGDALTYTITGAPAKGTASIKDSTLRFQPGRDFQDLGAGETRNVRIEVTATDPHGAQTTESVIVTVTGTEDVPTFRPSVLRAREDGEIVSMDLADVIVDPDGGGALNFALAGEPAAGEVWIEGTTLYFDPGHIYQDLAEGETRSLSVPITVFENGGVPRSYVIPVEVEGTNDRPELSRRGVAVDPETLTAQIDLAELTSDPDASESDGPYTYEIVGEGRAGQATLDGSILRYDANGETAYLEDGEVGRMVYEIKVTDQHGASSVERMRFEVTGVNDAPILRSGQTVFQVDEDLPVQLDFGHLFSDPEGHPMTYSLTPLYTPAEGEVVVEGSTLIFDPLSYQDLESGEVQSLFFEARAHDAAGSSPVQVIELQIVGEDGPVYRPSEDGFFITSSRPNTQLGKVVRSVGDLDADGVDDFFVQGRLFYGQDESIGEFFPERIDFLSFEDTTGLGGTKIASGDFNGDGIDDIVLNGTVLFGRAGGFGPDPDLSALDGTDGFHFMTGGSAPASADVNGDGLSDILYHVSSASSYTGIAGPATVVIYGQTEGFDAEFTLAGKDETELAIVYGADDEGPLVNVGDTNGDGHDDLIMRSAEDGKTYLVFGAEDGWWSEAGGVNQWYTSDKVLLDNSRDRHISHNPVDINGDGLNDIVLESDARQLSVVFGSDTGFPESVDLRQLSGTDGFMLKGDYSFIELAGAGDLNGDGLEDLVVSGSRGQEYPVGQEWYWKDVPRVYVVFGAETGLGASIDLDNLEPEQGFIIQGPDNSFLGQSIDAAGDINGDGYDDLLIGGPFADVDGVENGGVVQVIYGGPDIASNFEALPPLDEIV